MNLLEEQRVTLTQAAERFDVAPSTTWRWALRGVRRVKLETFSVGAKRFTTVQALERFVEATTAAAVSDLQTPNQRSRERKITEAQRELEEEGA